MKQTTTIVLACILLAITLAFSIGCNISGTSIRLEKMSLGTVTMDGKPIQGLPADKIDLLLQVATNEITIKYDAGRTTLTLNPSGATIEINASGILINGMKPEQVKMEWVVSGQDK